MVLSIENFNKLQEELALKKATLVAVSKLKTAEDILELYKLGQRDFGENFVQELLIKYELLPKDIRWHFIGHLQSNKVKYIVPFVHLIHGIDRQRLLSEINKQAATAGTTVNCLLQIHIAEEETKFGMDEMELEKIVIEQYQNIKISGLMGIASFSSDQNKIRDEFKKLKTLFDKLKMKYSFSILSMGMSGDYKLALEEGSNMVRIGSLLFGNRR